MIAVCVNCEKEYKVEAANVTQSYLPDRPAVTNYSLVCPHCKHTTHAYYLDGKLRRIQMDVRTALQNFQARPTDAKWQRYKKLQEKYRAAFDALNPKVEPAKAE